MAAAVVRQRSRFAAAIALWLGATSTAAFEGADALKSDLALASVSAVAVDLGSERLLVAKHPDAVLPIASVTKVMTAMVVLDSGAPVDDWLAIAPWTTVVTPALKLVRTMSDSRTKS